MTQLKCSDIVKLQMDYFYSDPEIVAQAYIATGEPSILQECKKRNIDIGPHLQREMDRHNRIMGLLKTR